MRLHRIPFLIVITATFFLLAAGDPPPTPASPEIKAELAEAFSTRLQAFNENRLLVMDVFTPELDAAFISPSGETAVLWLALRDDSGRILATEPGLALARLGPDGWNVLLPGDPGWDETLANLPDGMLPLEQLPAPGDAPAPAAPAAPLQGYYLPYAAGTARWLEGSISHFQNIPELGYPSCTIEYCHYAYDFTDTGHFPLLASKDGTVIGSRDSCTDGSEICTNYIVLHNASDNAYQIYLHLSNGTIPDKLTAGTAVLRGQYLGDTDDTGYSTSNHVHFMVTSDIWMGGPANYQYYWGHSIDIRFADVAINNGIPRNCYEISHFQVYDGANQCLASTGDRYTSGNVGAYPPAGSLTRPAAGITVTSGPNPLIDVTAYPTDDVQVTAVRLMASIGGQWVEIGPKITQPVAPGKYDWDVNLCEVGPLNGPLDVALRAWDHEGNISGPLSPRTIQVEHSCPPPTSQLLPAQSFASTALRLNWDGAAAGAGLSAYELQWRLAGGTWEAANTLAFPASQHSAWLSGEGGSTYGFRLRALDSNGQPEAWPAGDLPEIEITLPSSCTQDASEPDDTAVQGRGLVLGEEAQGNLCGQGNADWFLVDVNPASRYAIRAASLNGGAAVRLTAYGQDGQSVLAMGQAAGLGMDASLRFNPAGESQVYIQVEPLIPNLFGSDAMYALVVSESQDVFLPLLFR